MSRRIISATVVVTRIVSPRTTQGTTFIRTLPRPVFVTRISRPTH